MKSVQWGIIGCGNVTEIKSGPGFQLATNSKLVHVMRRQGDLARDYAQRHGVPKWSDEALKVIQDPEVNAVYIATPPGSHLEYALACAVAKKACYVEKPMARNYDECMQMMNAFVQAEVPLYVAYYRRALPRFIKIKEIIDSGKLGSIRHIHAVLEQSPEKNDLLPETLPWRLKPSLSGGGRLLDLGSHTLDILDYFFGPIVNVRSITENHGGFYAPEDLVSGVFQFASKLTASCHWCFCAGIQREFVEVIGEKGLLRFSIFGQEDLELQTLEKIEKIPAPNPKHIQQPLIQSIVDELTGVGLCKSTGLTASRTNLVMDQFLQDYRLSHQHDLNAVFL